MVAVRQEVRVDRPAADAFRLFTAGIGQWWPVEEGYSFGRDRASEIHLEATPGGRLYERFVDGEELLIGRVLECDPPHRIVFTWKGPDWPGETEVEVSFAAEGERTLVAVEHRGFERLGPEGDRRYRQFGGGWPRIMRLYVVYSGRAP
jgi:uncharacterized protein YndB with AHSA1/START domain